MKELKILGVETTCDETGLALIKRKGKRFEIFENLLISQVELHKPYGGVYPSVAKREHQKALPILLEGLCQKWGKGTKREIKGGVRKKLKEVVEREKDMAERMFKVLERCSLGFDLVSLALGPGLEPCLWVGVNFAKLLSFVERKPVLLTNHLRAHLWANFLERELDEALLPAIGLVVSGGHTVLVLIKKGFKFEVLGETRDDAAGECFDKTARLLGLGYPGGPEISRLADSFDGETSISLPRPMLYSKDLDFSFSGLKTAVLYSLRGRRKTERLKKEMAKAIQEAIVEVLVKKTLRAVKEKKAKSLWLGGGVVANRFLQQRIKEGAQKLGVEILIPPRFLITDNALMIALGGAIEYELGLSKPVDSEKVLQLRAQPSFKITEFY